MHLRHRLILLSVLLICACNDDNSRVGLTGTVATGLAVANAAVTAISADGKAVTGTTGSDGSYTFNDAITYPVLLKASKGTLTLYSWAFSAGTANITPLTTVALIVNASLPDNLDALYATWPGNVSSISEKDMLDAQAVVNANLQSEFIDENLPFQTYNFLRADFNASTDGIDAVLDGLEFIFDFANQIFVITLNNGTTVPFDFSPDISNIIVNNSEVLCESPVVITRPDVTPGPGYIVFFKDAVDAADELRRLVSIYKLDAVKEYHNVSGFFAEMSDATRERLRCEASISSIHYNTPFFANTE
jgi:hypothetical protein